MANVLVRIDVQNQVGPAPLNGVTVRVYEADGTTFVTEGVTGAPFAAGRVEFTLFGDNPAENYVIRLSLAGWRFPAGATQTIAVSDPPAPDNDFGPYDALLGPTAVLATLVVQDDQLVPDGIQNVRLFVYTALDVFITEVVTDALGEAVIPLAGSPLGTTYIVRMQKNGVLFTAPTQTISVLDPVSPPNTNTFDFTGHIVEFPESTDPDMCTVYGYFTDVSLLPAKKLRFEFKPCPCFDEVGDPLTPHGTGRLLGVFTGNPTLVRDRILTRSVKADTDKTGFVSVELPRGGYFEVHIHGFEDPIEITERIYIPDAPNARLMDLIYPFVQSVVYDPTTVAVGVGETAEVEITVTMSSTEVIKNKKAIADLLEFKADDASIAEVTLFSEEKLAVKGLQVGSTTIVATRKADVVVPSRPPVAALVVTPATVNVS